MINSIKFILNYKNMQQKELESTNDSKQTVSRWVLRKRKIPSHIINKWEVILNVPSKFFVDKEGYCKELNDAELSELRDYFFYRQYEGLEDKFRTNYQVQKQERLYEFSKRVVSIQKKIKSDIYDVHCNDIDEFDEIINIQENNVLYYEKILYLHKCNKIHSDEWDFIFKTLFLIADNASEEKVNEENILVQELYKLIINNRIKQKEKNMQMFNELNELFDFDIEL